MADVLVQSVKRALDALDYVAAECVAADGVRLGEIAGHVGLKATTMRNILRTMEACGYIGRAEGRLYRPGPRCSRLAFGGSYARTLLRVARPAMDAFAEATQESLVLTCLAGGMRRVLARHEGGHLLTVNAQRMDEGNPYGLVTSRVLLAHASPDEVRAFVAKCGVPGAAWDNATTAGQVQKAARKLRDRRVVEYSASDDVVALASPIDTSVNGPPFALGMYLPSVRYGPRRADNLRNALAETAAAIAREMRSNEKEL
jgi:IclR family acetate operon transcriptional repressor